MTEETAPKKQPTHRAYHVHNSPDGKARFMEIGAGFPHKDGKGLDVLTPGIATLDGRITLREIEQRLEAGKEGKSAERPRDNGGRDR